MVVHSIRNTSRQLEIWYSGEQSRLETDLGSHGNPCTLQILGMCPHLGYEEKCDQERIQGISGQRGISVEEMVIESF